MSPRKFSGANASGGYATAWKVTLEIHLERQRVLSHDTQRHVQTQEP